MSVPASRVRLRLERGAFSLDVDAAWDERVVVVFGPSGSGKSTLFEALLGLVRAPRCAIRLWGATLDEPSRGIHLSPERRRLGWVPQRPTLFPHLSVERNVRFGQARARGDADAALSRAVEVLELGALLARGVESLSGGERQRVAIARAIASGPQALLLDEPLASLDLPLRARALRYLLRVRDELGLPILYITHDPDEALLVGERVLVLDAGRLVASGLPREVLWSRAVLPVSAALGIENAFDARVAESAEGSSVVETARGLRLVIPVGLPAGEAVCVGLRAEDVLLTADVPGRVSARNALRATVTDCQLAGADALVHLDASGERLVAKVTAEAARKLALRRGTEVHALVKAQAIRRIA